MEKIKQESLTSNKCRRKSSSQLKPLLNAKVDELFLRWISLPSQNNLIQNLKQIKLNSEIKVTENEVQLAKEPVSHAPSLLTQPTSKDDSKPIVSPRRLANGSIRRRPSSEKLGILIQSGPDESTRRDQLSVTHKANESPAVNLPRFYFPNGKPCTSYGIKEFEKRISTVFSNANAKLLKLSQMAPVCSSCGCPIYWKAAVFRKAAKRNSDSVSAADIIALWENITSKYHDETSRFIALLAKSGNKVLEFDDFLPLLSDIVDTHPGLIFLKEAPEFHTRYMNTVVARIFYTVNRSWSGKITANELRRSNFLAVLASLENEPDINMVTEYFSYEHFYVIYCKFWELDTDHDLVIDRNDLARHSDGVLCSRLVDRVLSGAVTRWSDPNAKTSGCMSYIDFVWFLISEEDKKTRTSIEYWFRCMDLDGDGCISLYEMEYFYEEQMRKLELLDIEALPFEDCACQMLDMIKPVKPDCISLSDLKKSQLAGTFFDTFLNIEKYLEHEQKDPFANVLLGEEGGPESPKQTDWERYAAEEYEILVAEEQANERKSGLDAETSFNDSISDPLLEEELRNLGIMSDDPLNTRFGGMTSSNSSIRPNSPASLAVQ